MAESVLVVLEGRPDPPLVDVLQRARATKVLRSAWSIANSSGSSIVQTLTGYLPAHAPALVCELCPPGDDRGFVVFVLQPGRPGAEYAPLVNALSGAGAKRLLQTAWMFEESSSADVTETIAPFVYAEDQLVVSDVAAWQGKGLRSALRGAWPRFIPSWVGGHGRSKT